MKKFFIFLILLVVLSVAVSVDRETAHANAGDDTLRTATVIKGAGSVAGVLNGGNDKDYYVFEAPNNGLFTVKMSNAGNSKTIDILNADGTVAFSTLTTDDGMLGDASRSVGLKKGQKIFLCVNKYAGYDVSYNLKFSFKQGNNYEKESNNTIRTANLISATSKTTGELQGGRDEDYFKFTLKAAGNVNVKMSNAGNSKTIRLLNSKQEELMTIGTNNELLGNASRNIGLAKGTYYIKVSNYAGYYVPYILNLKYTKSNYYEKEWNNTLRTANTIILNKNYNGVLEGGRDEDYFKFKVTKKKTVKLYLNNSGKTKGLYLLNTKGDTIGSVSTNPSSNGNSSLKATLKKGTYYIKVGNYAGYNQPYKLKVK